MTEVITPQISLCQHSRKFGLSTFLTERQSIDSSGSNAYYIAESPMMLEID